MDFIYSTDLKEPDYADVSYSLDTAILVQVVSHLREALKCRKAEIFQTRVFLHRKTCRLWKIVHTDIVSKPHRQLVIEARNGSVETGCGYR